MKMSQTLNQDIDHLIDVCHGLRHNSAKGGWGAQATEAADAISDVIMSVSTIADHLKHRGM